MLGWTEIRNRATSFAREYAGAERETRDYADFWTDFFDIFGVRRRSVSLYQEEVKKINGERGFIDLFWPGMLLVEHKSAGKNLDSAFLQASEYVFALAEERRPRFVIVSDFKKIRLYDLEAEKKEEQVIEFPLEELPKHIRHFGFIAGYKVRVFQESDPVNRKAVDVVVRLYHALETGDYPREWLGRLMVRLVFLFFAEDAGVFVQRNIFKEYIQYFTKEDGSDLGAHLGAIFQVLNTPDEKRQGALTSELREFPYVNGSLFADPLPLPFFGREMRREILRAADFDWGAVSPAIFGSMFQYVMDMEPGDVRHDFGAHYTSEKNIMKVIHGLFLDELHGELAAAGANRVKLEALWNKVAGITLLDPACGCGNFLVVAYRELRLIELEIITRLYRRELTASPDAARLPMAVEVARLSKLSIERMYGIELLEFPVEIAKLSLYFIDHQMNMRLGELFGTYYAKLPLREQPHIVCGNALTLDWNTLVRRSELSYILGNPPFIGSRVMSEEQKQEMHAVFGGLREVGFLDYVAAWYLKAARYLAGTDIRAAFVSTNSITQGEQAGILWEALAPCHLHIQFAHRTFRWANEARGKAAVYCVIIGFGARIPSAPRLFDYGDVGGEPHEVPAARINAYLVDGPEVIVRNRQEPLCAVPEMSFGNMPRDGGFLIFDEPAREVFLREEPEAEKFLRLYLGAQEFLHGERRWCLWLVGADPAEVHRLPVLMRRLQMVRDFRLMSRAESTRRMAETPGLFAQRTQPDTDYVLVPRVSSENRHYVPMGFFSKEIIVSDSCLSIPAATLYHFGVLESEMHMAWMRAVCGRLEMRYRYSKDIVYNNLPWPDAETENQTREIEAAAQAVLDARAVHSGATLADLYDPLTMPEDLLGAHQTLDRAVDRAYGHPRGFVSETERLAYLFGCYRALAEKSATGHAPRKR